MDTIRNRKIQGTGRFTDGRMETLRRDLRLTDSKAKR